MKGELNMKEYQKPEIELLDFTAEKITDGNFTIPGVDSDFGVTDGSSNNDEI